MEFSVKDQCLSASGGSFQVRYRCKVEIASGDGEAKVVVVSTIPDNACSELLAATIEHLRSGAQEVLRPRGLRGELWFHDLLIHDVDCNPPQYRKVTIEGLKKCLGVVE